MNLPELIGQGGKVVELNCGNGWLAALIDYQSYTGYDSSLENILAAKARQLPEAEFSLADVMRFQSDENYDTLIALVVDENIKLHIMRFWSATRFIFNNHVHIPGEVRYDIKP